MRRTLLIILSAAVSLWTGGIASLAIPVAQAQDAVPELKVLGSHDTLRQSGLRGEELKQAFLDDYQTLEQLRKISAEAASINAQNVSNPPSIVETPIATLIPDTWAGLTEQASDASGRQYVLWWDFRDTAGFFQASLYFSRSTDQGNTWSTPVRIDNSAGLAHVGPAFSLAADQNGNLFVVWDDGRNSVLPDTQVMFSRSNDAGVTWSAPAVLDGAAHMAIFFDQVDATFDTAGGAHIVWADSRSGAGTMIFAANSLDAGRNWSAGVHIDDTAGADIEDAPTIASSRPGDVDVFWRTSRFVGPGEDLMHSHSADNGVTWSANSRVGTEAAASYFQNNWDSCIDGEGHVLFVWDTDDAVAVGDAHKMWGRVSSDHGVTFGDRITVSADADTTTEPMALACGGNGYMGVAFQDSNNDSYVASSRDAGATWTTARVDLDLDAGVADVDQAVMDVDSQGHMVLAFTDSRNSGVNDLWVTFSNDGGLTWSSSNLKASNGLSGSDEVILANGGLGPMNRGGETNDRLTFNLCFYTDRAGAPGIYHTAVTFDGTKTSIRRLASTNRYTTGVAIAKDQFPTAGSITAAVFATGENYPDGLAATPLAAMLNGPVFLVKKDTLPSEVAAEFLREYDGKSDPLIDAYVIGGTSAVSNAVANAISALGASIQLKRLEGSNRKATAVAVAQEMDSLRGRGPTQAVLANAGGFADALTGGAIAGNTGLQNDRMPVLLSDTGSLSTEVAAYLSSVSATLSTVHIIGGSAAISDGTAAAADALIPTVARHAGSNRYATAAQAATDFFTGVLAPQSFGLASGTNFPDALTGGLWAALHLAPLLLTNPTTLSDEAVNYLSTNQGTLDAGVVFGGTSAVSDSAMGLAGALY